MAIQQLSFTTTATNRPEVHKRTFSSFTKRLKGVDFAKVPFYINVDPLPSQKDIFEVTETAMDFFGRVHIRNPPRPNFTGAYNWVWSKPETEYIFNLEDDWELTEDIHIDTLLEYFKNCDTLMQVVLRAYHTNYNKIALSPSLIHKRLYKAVGGKLDETLNPEIQLRGENFGIRMPSPEFKVAHKGKVIAYPESKKRVVVKDIGRAWIKKSGFKKPDKKGRFTSWVKK